MKVLMFGWEFPPFKSGGLGTYLYGFTKALFHKNVKVTFVMPHTGMEIKPGFVNVVQADGSYSHVKLFDIKGFDLTPYNPSIELSTSHSAGSKVGSSKQAYGLDFFSKVRDYTVASVHKVKGEACDLIHCHDWMTYPAGILLKKIKRKPLVVTIHSTEYDRTGSLNPNHNIKEIERRGLHEADKVITISNYMKNQLIERYNIPEEKIRVVYNGLDKEHYVLKDKPKVGVKEKIVLFLGRLTIQKGPDWFLEAAYRVLKIDPNVKFVVVGNGDMLPQLINKAIAMRIIDKIVFAGFREDVQKYYSSADVYVMPSVAEPFGLTALEAMASHTPVIISKQAGVAEVVQNCMKADFWDSDELANKILGVLHYNALKNSMSQNGFHEVQKFSWDEVAENCINVYKEVIN
ncbi:MAG: glycosyltransferase family 4 protein [Candidatus Diapherotrites archaeon]